MDYFTSFSIKDFADILCVALLLFYIYKMMKAECNYELGLKNQKSGKCNGFVGA